MTIKFVHNNCVKLFKKLDLLVLIVLIGYIDLTKAGWSYELESKACATLFTGVDFNGFKKLIHNGRAYSDLSSLNLKPNLKNFFEATQSSDTWANQTSSIILELGCRLQICLGTHFEGNCTFITSSTTSLDSVWRQKVSSLECGCPAANCKTQTCPEIKLPKSECARVYFEPNCSNCVGKYLTILPLDERRNAGNLTQGFSSVVVKPGCTFNAFTGKAFTDERITLNSEFRSSWDSKFLIQSYNCSCLQNMTEEVSVPIQVHPDTSNYPRPLNLTMTLKENDENYESEHPAFTAARISKRNDRSSRNAYILVIGLTQSGKSSTINLMLGQNITVKDIDKCTIHEYQIPVQVDELGCANCELRIIDTPGFGHSDGYEQDVSFLAGLEHYLKHHHEELRDHKPNVVLVFSKFNDDRLNGTLSPFVKVLRGIDFFRKRLFDPEYSNAVTVLTHFMSQNEEIRNNPARMITKFRAFIEEFTLFPMPLRIAVAENHLQGVPMINGFYYLPNREYYPLNIFRKMADATGAHDPLGEAIIRNAFNRGISNLNVVTTTSFNMCGVNTLRREYYSNEFNLNIENTGVSKALDIAYREIEEDLKSKFPSSLKRLKRTLSLHKMFESSQLQELTQVKVFDLFRKMRHDPLILKLMEKAFHLEIPRFEKSIVAGQSYNILTDTVLESSPFQAVDPIPSEIGFKILGLVDCELVNEVANVYHWNDTDKQYHKYRVSSLKGNSRRITAALTGDIRPGFNTQESYGKSHKVSAFKEYRKFQLTLKDGLALDPEFLMQLRNISKLDRSNLTSVNEWTKFFSQHGTHVVKSVFGGGAIEVKFSLKTLNSSSLNPMKEFDAPIQKYFRFLDEKYHPEIKSTSVITSSNVTYSVKCTGGDRDKHINSLFITETNAKNLASFMKSLTHQPEILTTSMELIPINEILQNTDPGSFNKINLALEALLNGELKHKPPSRQSANANAIKHTREGFASQIAYRLPDKKKPRRNRNLG